MLQRRPGAFGPAAAKPLQHRRGIQIIAAGFGFGKKPANAQTSKSCPCGSGQDYQACCQRYHKSLTVQAPTPEAVLRARFSAYAKKEWKYVVRTTHPDNPNTRGSVAPDGKLRITFEEDVKVSMYNFEFVRFQLLGQRPGSNPDEALLDFQTDTRQKMDGKGRKLEKPIPRSIRESALFVRTADGAWEFLRALDSNWDRDKLDYRGEEAAEAAEEAEEAQPAAAPAAGS